MIFNDLSFYVFLATVIALYRLLPYAVGKIVLVIASYLFYGLANPFYVFLLLFSTTTDFFVAKRIEAVSTQKKKKRWLLLSLTVNLSLLGVFKYGDFVIQNVNFLASPLGWDQLPYLHLILPVGISFYTFQTLAYSIDVYRGEQKAETDFMAFALYVGYFPQLVAGPIERAKKLLPQLKQKHKVSQEQFLHGMERILWGLVKKMVFADRLAVPVAVVYGDVHNYSALELWMATACFSIQLYLDFSAYSDIAIGIARLMGVKLSENFNYPFVSASQKEHWNKWHITLTQWFRDYVYRSIMKKGERKPLKQMLSVMLVFSLTGIWHGATWNMFLFGWLAGVYIVVQAVLPNLVLWFTGVSRKVIKAGTILFNYWVLWFSLGPFFILSSFSDAKHVYSKWFSSSWSLHSVGEELFLFFLLSFALYVLHAIRSQFIPRIRSGELQLNYNRVPTNLALLILLIFGAYEYKMSFIYFQF